MGFLSLQILISLLGYKFLIFGLGASLVFSRKINNEDTIIPFKGGTYIFVLRGFTILLFYWNNSNTKISLNFNKNKDACRDVFIVFIWLPHPNTLGQQQARGHDKVTRPQTLRHGMVVKHLTLELGISARPGRLRYGKATRPRVLKQAWLLNPNVSSLERLADPSIMGLVGASNPY